MAQPALYERPGNHQEHRRRWDGRHPGRTARPHRRGDRPGIFGEIPLRQLQQGTLLLQLQHRGLYIQQLGLHPKFLGGQPKGQPAQAIEELLRNGSLSVSSAGGRNLYSLNLAPTLESRDYLANGEQVWMYGIAATNALDSSSAMAGLSSNTYP